MKLHYKTYRSYLRARFGRPILRIPVNAGFDCPNRDGTISRRGCTFCDNATFSPVATVETPGVEQLRAAISLASPRYELFIAYLQPYSNTYAPVKRLRQVYEPLLGITGVVGLAVGTRPDCVPKDVCDYLAEVAKRTYLCVELGLQSTDDRVLAACGRGHTFADFVEAVKRLAERGIEIVAHLMVGLPGQTAAQVLRMAEQLSTMPVAGVKLHQLMVVRGTPMERLYEEGGVVAPALEEYVELVGEFIARLRPDQHIHRVSAQSTKERGLIAPEWSVEKSRVVEALNAFMERAGIMQGSRLCSESIHTHKQ
ncbi:MAG: TIGR01212 family radical SAM protein [Chitinivibrionales bacterium]|nr:TIGR01212 family radical SAM protein [Chitinivibrionales bacterium]MBD3357621.1 TIGR01212 family radical SAM protein [Chitinivibrionales bacterium]